MTWRLAYAGDSVLLLELEPRIDPLVNAQALTIAERIRALALPGVRDVVSTYHTVAVYFDPLRIDAAEIERLLGEAATQTTMPAAREGRQVTVPVCYGGEFGPDLEEVARLAGCSPEEVVTRHAGRAYRVYMLGFVPGFPYLGVVDERIAVPRRDTPRPRVAAGSVGLAGAQTGIYPLETPGGWRIIGRTPLRIFDPARTDPFLLKPGDTVRFQPISSATFERLREGS